jgi:hypothetical protein
LFQSTEGIDFLSLCPKGSNSDDYQGTFCQGSPDVTPTTGFKSLIYAQMSNQNKDLKYQSGNNGHVMKQWCGTMLW